MYCTADNVQWSARGARGWGWARLREGPRQARLIMSAAAAGRRYHACTTAASQHATRRTERKHLMLWHIRGCLGRCAVHGPSRHPAGCCRGCKGAHRLSGQLGEAAAAPADIGAHILESLERHRRHAVVQDGGLLPSPLLPELGGAGRWEAGGGCQSSQPCLYTPLTALAGLHKARHGTPALERAALVHARAGAHGNSPF
jgi:hypothetical protein